MRYLVTGHTGFKGAWLTLILTHLGHEVCGLSLDPEPGSLFDLARLHDLVSNDIRGNIRDAELVRNVITSLGPDVVVHMAAQPLVRESYDDPRGTMETNVMGTLNVLQAVRETPSVKAQLIITTDKVYRNENREIGYIEGDPLGGHDPYSASKAMADLLTQSWSSSFETCPTAVARAGNVIGGGDVSRNRLLPDLLRSFSNEEVAQLRFPDAVRPWQHVLDCLSGYTLLIDSLLLGQGRGAWNFGPPDINLVSVGRVADIVSSYWGPTAKWAAVPGSFPHEAALLTLDATKARSVLGWRDKLSLDSAVELSVVWQKRVLRGDDPRTVSMDQIKKYESM